MEFTVPTAAPKPCTQCGTLVHDGSSRCMVHKVKAWVRRVDVPKRQTGRALQRKRAELFAREPECRECMRLGRFRLATVRDHIVPLAEGGDDADENVQPLCGACHDAKTARESARGGGRQKSQPKAPETDLVAKFLCAGNGTGGVPPTGRGGAA